MNKKLFTLGMVTVLSVGLVACNSADKTSGEKHNRQMLVRRKKTKTKNYIFR